MIHNYYFTSDFVWLMHRRPLRKRLPTATVYTQIVHSPKSDASRTSLATTGWALRYRREPRQYILWTRALSELLEVNGALIPFHFHVSCHAAFWDLWFARACLFPRIHIAFKITKHHIASRNRRETSFVRFSMPHLSQEFHDTENTHDCLRVAMPFCFSMGTVRALVNHKSHNAVWGVFDENVRPVTYLSLQPKISTHLSDASCNCRIKEAFFS